MSVVNREEVSQRMYTDEIDVSVGCVYETGIHASRKCGNVRSLTTPPFSSK